jgi:hypothetical protein
MKTRSEEALMPVSNECKNCFCKSYLNLPQKDETQKWMSVSAAVARQKAIQAKAGFKNVSEVKESSI